MIGFSILATAGRGLGLVEPLVGDQFPVLKAVVGRCRGGGGGQGEGKAADALLQGGPERPARPHPINALCYPTGTTGAAAVTSRPTGAQALRCRESRHAVRKLGHHHHLAKSLL